MAEKRVSNSNIVSSDTSVSAPPEVAALREWRLRRHLSHRQLAKLADVTTYTLLRIEKGNPTRPLTRRKIADALGLAETQIGEFLHDMQQGSTPRQMDTVSGTG
jgi:DNA-binding XRE family transcriptional regulator